MILKSYNKFEYKYEKLQSNIKNTVEKLNSFGNEGWEVIFFKEPHDSYGSYEVLLKRELNIVEDLK